MICRSPTHTLVNKWNRIVNRASLIPFGGSLCDLHVHLDGSVPLQHILHTPAMQSCFTLDEAQAPASTQCSQHLKHCGDDTSVPASPPGREGLLQRRIWQRDVSRYMGALGAATPQGGTSLAVFDFMNAHLQTANDMRAAVAGIDARCSPGVTSEIRFCPSLHTHRGLSARGAVRAVQDAVGLGRTVTLCALRHLGLGHFQEVLALAEEFGCAVDIAGDEGAAPFATGQCWAGRGGTTALAGLDMFVDAAQQGRIRGVTAHAGEWPGTDASLAAAARSLGRAQTNARLGHALQFGPRAQAELQTIRRGLGKGSEGGERRSSLHNAHMLENLHGTLGPGLCFGSGSGGENRITIEVCLTSNVAGSERRGQPIWYHEHPLPLMVLAKQPVVLCTDNHVTSGNAYTGPAALRREQAHAFMCLAQLAVHLDLPQWRAARGSRETRHSVGWLHQRLRQQEAGPMYSALCSEQNEGNQRVLHSLLWAWSHVWEMGVRSHEVAFTARGSEPKWRLLREQMLPSHATQTAVLHALSESSWYEKDLWRFVLEDAAARF